MLAFAANSLLNRAAMDALLIDPVGFAALRVIAGASVLTLALWFQQKRFFARPTDIWGPLGLVGYMLAFSLAYVALDAGFGALLLFGTVQLTMFAASFGTGQKPLRAEMGGSLVAFSGLVYLLAPNLSAIGLLPSMFMVIAGIGWAMFTISGRGASNPLSASAACFAATVPVTLLAWYALP